MNLPNILSFIRIFLVPVFIWSVQNDLMLQALLLFGLAGLTDALDGFIAKRFSMVTELGKFLDPLADKILLIAGFITLSLNNLLPLWLMLLVLTRELVIIGGALVFQVVTGHLKMEPLIISKVNTVMQMVLIVLVLLNSYYTLWSLLIDTIFIAVFFTTVISGLLYIIRWTHLAVEKENL